jgi:hypothetical protein
MLYLQVLFLKQVVNQFLSDVVISESPSIALQIPRIPNGNDVQQQAQAGGAIELAGEIAVGQDPKLPICDKTRQAMQRFSLVEHASYPASIGLVGKEGQNIEGLEQAPIFLQATMDEVLVVEQHLLLLACTYPCFLKSSHLAVCL